MPDKKLKVLISHTHNKQSRALQLSDLRYHYHIRSKDVKDVDVEYLDDGTTTPARRVEIQKWVDSNPTGFVYRNRALTPCAGIQTKKPKRSKVTKKKKSLVAN